MQAIPTDAAVCTWIPFYEELADRLVLFRQNQSELIALLGTLRSNGLKVAQFEDRDASGRRFAIEEIDPFTFFAVFNRGITEQNRIAILKELKQYFGVSSPIPADFNGIPIANNQNSWFVSYKRHRQIEDVARLWDVFAAALDRDPMSNSAFAAAFDRALEVRGVNFNLTTGLFWIRPNTFVSLDSKLRSYLGLELPRGGLSFNSYSELLRRSRERAPRGFAELSHKAWLETDDSEPTPPEPKDINFWLVGAHWDSTTPPDQTERFVEESVWEHGDDDTYFDAVRSMKVGDRIAIKATMTQRKGLPFDAGGRTVSKLTIKAVGTVVHNPGDGRAVEVDWEHPVQRRDWYFYTARSTVWRLRKDDELARQLIDFAFRGKPQDYEFFREKWWPATKTQVPDVTGKIEDAHPYAVADMLDDGIFLGEAEIESMLNRLRIKKNVILQGAPGVGKTFVAKRLAYALMEARDDTRITFVQFHPSYCYEDFVRGYRPTQTAGGFELRDGPLIRACRAAANDVDRKHVLIVDEINRGNLSQVFGELFMLLEADKRGVEHQLTPLYPANDSERFFVPRNLHVIGTMNIADRSLALVDFALRRRFAFVTLEPRIGDPIFRGWLKERKMPADLVDRIVSRIGRVNELINDDSRLGPAFRIGHSFFCPCGDDFSSLDLGWFNEIVETEIGPLLFEYWYDEPAKARDAVDQLRTK